MRVSTFVTVVVSTVLVAACGSVPPVAPPSDVPVPAASSLQTVSSPSDEGSPSYSLYRDGVTGRGKSIVLFFAKADDPFSQRSDRLIRKLYASGAALVSTYRIDADASTGAKLTYGVIVPDTFVLLGPDGERQMNLIHPADAAELQTLLAPAR